VARSLEALDFGAAEVIVRINHPETGAGYRDLVELVPCRPQAFLLPKVSTAQEVRHVAWTLDRLESLHSLPAGAIRLMCMIESAAGVVAAAEIAAAPRVTALIFGANDLVSDLGCGVEGAAVRHAALQVLLAGRAAGVDVVDTPHMQPADLDGLARSAQAARELGFDGKSAIHPAQVGPINAAFALTPAQIAWAERVIAALDAERSGGPLGGALLDGEYVEAPHLARARRILAVAALVAGRR
jgi:citrate lyase subunit beta/citryl-CoA lyase